MIHYELIDKLELNKKCNVIVEWNEMKLISDK